MKRATLALLPLLCLGWTFADLRPRFEPPEREWVTIATSARVTFYGKTYVPGMVAASGERYRFERVCALGPKLLAFARLHSGRVWGMRVRVTDPATGRSGEFRVIDTGMPELDVDLPDPIWQQVFGYPLDKGVFNGIVEVRR